MTNKLIYLARVLRVKQWVKNTFILFPLIFSGHFFVEKLWVNTLWAFAGFCALSSSLYIFNDFLDMKRDRLHPKKSQRPLARYPVNKVFVISAILVLELIGLTLCRNAGVLVLFTAVVYVLIHLLYNFYIKRVVILDVVFIAAGFHVRIWAGAVAIQVFPSVWLQMCVFLLALFLGFTKRRYEIATLGEKAPEHRSVLSDYTAYLLDQIIIICSTLAIVFYGLYTISPDIVGRMGNYNMVYSVVFVIYGIFRYLYLTHVKKLGDDPGDVLFSDKPLLINIILWVFYVGVLLYL